MKNNRILWSLALVTAFLLITFFAFRIASSRAQTALVEQFPPPGELVNMDGYALHLNCVGEGTPTVLMEAGLGEYSLTWTAVQPEITSVTRVCTYDRAGYGWSDPGPTPRDAAAIIADLQTLLDRTNETGPFVLVGHSYGGMLMRLFAAENPDLTAGVVLVDSSHPDQTARFPALYQEAEAQLLTDLADQYVLPKFYANIGLLPLIVDRLATNNTLPEAAREPTRALLASDTDYYDTMLDEVRILSQSIEQVRAAGNPFADSPLIVLAAGRADEPYPEVGLTEEIVLDKQAVWLELQAELAALSVDSELIVIEDSGHYIQYEQPEIVVDAIIRMVNRVQQRGE